MRQEGRYTGIQVIRQTSRQAGKGRIYGHGVINTASIARVGTAAYRNKCLKKRIFLLKPGLYRIGILDL